MMTMTIEYVDIDELKNVLPSQVTNDELVTLIYFIVALYVNDTEKAKLILAKTTYHVYDAFEDIRSYCNDGEILQ